MHYTFQGKKITKMQIELKIDEFESCKYVNKNKKLYEKNFFLSTILLIKIKHDQIFLMETSTIEYLIRYTCFIIYCLRDKKNSIKKLLLFRIYSIEFSF